MGTPRGTGHGKLVDSRNKGEEMHPRQRCCYRVQGALWLDLWTAVGEKKYHKEYH